MNSNNVQQCELGILATRKLQATLAFASKARKHKDQTKSI